MMTTRILKLFLIGFTFAIVTACAVVQPKPAQPEESDMTAALKKLASGAVEVCLNNTTYITNREVGFLSPKFMKGQADVCGVEKPAQAPAKKHHKKSRQVGS